MNVSRPCVCCENCLELIGRQSAKMASTWVQLVEKAESFAVLKVTYHIYEKHLQDLEQMGFIVSIDHEDYIQLKVLGRQYEPQGDYFFVCGGDCKSGW